MRIPTITALCSGGDWFAVFLHDKEPWFSLDRIAIFAVGRPEEYHGKYPHGRFQREEVDAVEGFVPMDGYLDAVSDVANFWGYLHKDDLTEERKAQLVTEAKEQAEHQQQGKAA